MNKPKNGKGKKTMNPNVDETELNAPEIDGAESETETANIAKGSGNKKLMDPFGKETLRKGTFSLPLAVDSSDAYQMCGGNESDVVFWFNFGRKLAARNQMNAALELDLGSKQLNDDYKSFENAMSEIGVTKDTPAEEREQIQKFILKQPKFAGILAKWDDIKTNGFGAVHLDFSQVELKKPSGKRGRPAETKDEAVTS